MAFVRKRYVKGRVYFQLVENTLKHGKVAQRLIKHLGNESRAKRYCQEHSIPFYREKLAEKPLDCGFFSSRQQVAEFLTAIHGRSEIPVKFEYMCDGAALWENVAHSKRYGLALTEKALVKENVEEIIRKIDGRANIIDLGCGTGETGGIFVSEAARHFEPKYVAVDISLQMLERANAHLSKRFPALNLEFHQLDFEGGNFAYLTDSLREKNYPTSLFLLLTNTLGNVIDKGRVLMNIRESMTFKDYLLIGIELFNLQRTQEILGHYLGNPFAEKAILNVLESHGVSVGDGIIRMGFNREKSQVEARFVLKKDVRIKVGRRNVPLQKGKKILLLISYKTTLHEMQALLNDTAFSIIATYLTPREDYALVLCRAVPF